MNKPMTRTEWQEYVNETWSDAIRLAYEEEIKRAVEEEREACAQVVENYAIQYDEPVWALKLTEAIRKRGEE